MTVGRRERTILLVFIPICALVLLYQLSLSPSLDKLRSLNSVIRRKKDDLRTVEMQIADHAKREAGVRELKEALEARGRSFNLFGYVNSTASKVKLRNRCKVELKAQLGRSGLDFKPSAVSVTLEGVSLKELTDFLYRIHADNKLLTVDPIEMSVPGSGGSGLNVTMTVSTLVRA
jgi:hypothetical protein